MLSLRPGRLSVELREDSLRERTADSGHMRKIVDACRLYALQAAEMREQRMAALGPDAADLLQRRGRSRLAAPGAMALDGEAVRLVANPLQQVQPRMVRRQRERSIAIGKNDLLQPGLALGTLGDAEELRCVQSLFGQYVGGDGNLT